MGIHPFFQDFMVQNGKDIRLILVWSLNVPMGRVHFLNSRKRRSIAWVILKAVKGKDFLAWRKDRSSCKSYLRQWIAFGKEAL